MDQIKIGKFIQEKRKSKNLTQLELAEKLNITDRAISKWECGKSLPDASIMLELCELLSISVNELLTGEELEMKDYDKQAELNLLELKRQKESSDKRLLNMEIVTGVIGTIIFVSAILLAALLDLPTWLRIVIIAISFVLIFVMCFFLVRIEQVAGYYECKHCHHRYVPTYKQVNLAMHMGRTRYMKCPKCGKKSWQKKVLSDTEE
ncbi:MAG: helix-turn-helix domain-containing protein [Gammaproteobacteria bacterium]|nr:helix-turn-helix domain-containing protein [Gammaproteobacteria bacterium]